MAGETLRFWYPGQPLTCRKCGGIGHLGGGCTAPRCFNCEQPGHRAHQCPEPPLCGICRAEDHHDATCPFLYYSGNIEEAGTPVAYATAVADEPGPNVHVAPVTEAAAAMPPPLPPPVKTKDLPARERGEGKRKSKQPVKSGDEKNDSLDGSDSETERERVRRRDWRKRLGRYRMSRAAESEREDRTRDRSVRPGLTLLIRPKTRNRK